MLSIFANAMRIASRTAQNETTAERHYRARQDLKKYDLEVYKRWAETEGRYLR